MAPRAGPWAGQEPGLAEPAGTGLPHAVGAGADELAPLAAVPADQQGGLGHGADAGLAGGDLDLGGGGLRLAASCTSFVIAAVAGAGQQAKQAKQGHRSSATPASAAGNQNGQGNDLALDEFQIIKAVVLGLVTCIILLSICKMVFQLFVQYAAKADER